MRKLRIAIALLLACSVSTGFANQLSIATGGTGGVYYPVGGGLAALIDKHIEGYSAVAEVTGASVENMALIHRGDSDLAIALADTVHQAYTGTGQFDKRQVKDVRAIATLYANAIHIITLADSGIKSLQDLKGKRVSIGAPGSGTAINAEILLAANGITEKDYQVRRLNFNETADALRDGDIDVGIWSVGPPTSSVVNLATTRDIRFIPLTAEEQKKAIARNPVFARATLDAGVYQGIDKPVSTLGIPNVLTVNASMSDDLAHSITELLYTRLDDLIAVHSAVKAVSVDFTLDASPIPLHPGAIRYYEKTGAKIPAKLRP